MCDFLSPPSSCDWSRARHEGINRFLRELRLQMSFSSAPAVATTMGLQLSASIKHSSASTLWVSLARIGWLRGCTPQFSREPHRPLQSNEFRFASFPRAWGMSYTARCNAPDFSLSSFCAFEELLIPILAIARLLISYSGVSVVENVVARLLHSNVFNFLALYFASKILSSALAWQQRSGSAFAGTKIVSKRCSSSPTRHWRGRCSPLPELSAWKSCSSNRAMHQKVERRCAIAGPVCYQ